MLLAAELTTLTFISVFHLCIDVPWNRTCDTLNKNWRGRQTEEQSENWEKLLGLPWLTSTSPPASSQDIIKFWLEVMCCILNESVTWKRVVPTLQVWKADLWKWMRRAKRKKHLIYMFLPPACLLSHFLPVWCQFGTDTARGARMTLSCHCFPTNARLTPFFSPSFFPLCSFLGVPGCTKTGDCCCRLKKSIFFPSI